MAKAFRCPQDGRFLRPGMVFSHNTKEIRYAHCPACEVIFAFVVGRSDDRAVASFAVDRDGVSARGVRLGSASELALAERGLQMIAWALVQHPEAAGLPAVTHKQSRGKRTRSRSRRYT
jgi:hypothetical protein